MGSDSDHRALILTDSRRNNNKSPIWQFNATFLKSTKHTEAIERIITLHPPIHNAHEWDDLKDNIRNYCKKAGKETKNKRIEGICNLTNRLNKLQRANNPNPAKIASITNRLTELERIQAEAMAI